MIRLHLLGPNQTTEIFFSYETPVAAFVPGRGFIRTKTKHSLTTSQHINKWLNGVSAMKMPQDYFDGLLNKVGG
jgi:hypothetical protein